MRGNPAAQCGCPLPKRCELVYKVEVQGTPVSDCTMNPLMSDSGTPESSFWERHGTKLEHFNKPHEIWLQMKNEAFREKNIVCNVSF